MSKSQSEDTRCWRSFWQMASPCNFTCFCWPPQLDSYRVMWILYSVIFLSLWCFHIFYRHQRFLQKDACFWCWIRGFHHSCYYPAISPNMVGIFDLSQLRRSHSKWIPWRSQCRSQVVGKLSGEFWWQRCWSVCFLRWFFEARNRFTISNNDQIWHVWHWDMKWRKGTTNWTSWMMYATGRIES